MDNKISLFVMPGCNMCPQMERLFHDLHQQGAIHELQIVDVTTHPELAEKYHIKSVPFYLINGIAFNGVKTYTEIKKLLQQNDFQKWISLIRGELVDGQLETVERYVKQHEAAGEAMMHLLADKDTELVVRIGLTAIIESMVEGSLLQPYEDKLIQLATHDDERIALDALYYLSLLSTPASLQALSDIAKNGKHSLREDALELLAETLSDRVLH